jgi:hypothetical protein
MTKLLGITVLLSGLVVAGCGKPPEMPKRWTEKDLQEKGLKVPPALALADPLQEQAPATHVPVERWRTHHLEYLNNGLVSQDQCMTCHQPEKYCNKCHEYVGVMRIVDTRKNASGQELAQGERTTP